MIAILIPAHDEESLIGACLQSALAASRWSGLLGEEAIVVVALDRCTDGTGAIAAAAGAHVIVSEAGTVGGTRAAAATYAIGLGARWLAMTDADSRVPPNWLEAQLAHGCDAFCGVVHVEDWQDYPAAMPAAFVGREQVRDGHPHVHGANLGISASAYLAVGGFRPLPVSEDVELIERVAARGLRIARKPAPLVSTSARRLARARGGFADYLADLEATLVAVPGSTRLDPR